MPPSSKDELMQTIKALEADNDNPNGWSAKQLAEIFTRILDSDQVHGIPNFPGMKETEALVLVDGEYSWLVPVSPSDEGAIVMGTPYFVKTTRLQHYLEGFPQTAGVPEVLEHIKTSIR